jgi:hypothetical protein
MTGATSFPPRSNTETELGITLDSSSICGHAGRVNETAYRDRWPVAVENPAGWPGFVLASPQDARYTSNSKAAGPLPQGTLSLGGSFFSCGGRA